MMPIIKYMWHVRLYGSIGVYNYFYHSSSMLLVYRTTLSRVPTWVLLRAFKSTVDQILFYLFVYPFFIVIFYCDRVPENNGWRTGSGTPSVW